MENERKRRPSGVRGIFVTAIVLTPILGFFFRRSFDPAYVLFSNDNPLGQVVASQHAQLPGFTGVWQNLNWLGGEAVSTLPSITTAFTLATTPQLFERIYAPLSLLIVGVSACFCLQRLGLIAPACVLGALAAALNSDFFSTACWGVPAHVITFACNFIALGLLADARARPSWGRLIGAGLAVGMGILESFDIGAIFAMAIGAYLLFQQLFLRERTVRSRMASGARQLTIVALFAALIAAPALNALIKTQITDVYAPDVNPLDSEAHWDWATQWSLPKREALGFVVAGLFGYRMDSPDGGSYWGAVGRDPAWDRFIAAGRIGNEPAGFLRYSGGGTYAGVLVFLVALWAACHALWPGDATFSAGQRLSLRFWMIVVCVSLLLAFGRFAPFYRFFYELPFVSTIRNPAKFVHLISFGLIVMFGFGADRLCRHCFEMKEPGTATLTATFARWWKQSATFDRTWLIACMAAAGLSLIAWLTYASFRQSLESYLRTVDFDAAAAHTIAAFSIRQMGWYVMFLFAAAGAIALILSGHFAGSWARRGVILLGVLLVVDLGRADVWWMSYWNVSHKYAANPIIDLLRTNPHEHRVSLLSSSPTQSRQMVLLHLLYRTEWLAHLFPYYGIQSLDLVQESRMPRDRRLFLNAVPQNAPRSWELTNTRYLLGATGDSLTRLNRLIDPKSDAFRIARLANGVPATFKLTAKTGTSGASLADYTAVPDPAGELAVFEFNRALPRAKLFSNWEAGTPDSAALSRIGDSAFDPNRVVLVANPIPQPAADDAGQDAGTVEILPNYTSTRMELLADVRTPAVLLLCDKFHPKWRVSVDGRQETVLRCDFLLRGVFLNRGKHRIVFLFHNPSPTLYISLASEALGLILCACALARFRRTSAEIIHSPSGRE
jgi:hypothetical protein